MTNPTSADAAKTGNPDHRLVLVILLGVTLALVFWFGSRYPALSEKALMGHQTPISGLAFETIAEILPDSGFWWKVAANTVNWLYTNWRGMVFGLLFGACLLSGLSLLQRRSFGQPFADAALGAAVGMPLGVCVNCAAPIAQGLHSSGTRLETTLAALLASPTLNVIVISMSFAILPTYMAVIKVLAMLGIILIAIPLLSRFVFHAETQLPARGRDKPAVVPLIGQARGNGGLERGAGREGRPHGWPQSIHWVSRTYLTNLLFLIKITVPLMLLAGFLGALVFTGLPFFEMISIVEPVKGTHGTILTMLVLIGLAIFLPVPIAFDVILASVLLASGWPAKYVMPVLLGLGSFSIYSFFIIGRAISYRVATVMSAVLAATAFGGGVVAWHFEKSSQARIWADILDVLNRPAVLQQPGIERPPAQSYDRLLARLNDQRIKRQSFDGEIIHKGEGRITLAIDSLRTNTGEPQGRTVEKFHRLSGGEIGLGEPHTFSAIKTFQPFLFYWGIAAGDVHGDGWDDIVIASDPLLGGLSLYANLGGHFQRQAVDLGPLDKSFVNAAALIDINGNGKLDLFVSTYLDGAHIFWNQDGSFDAGHRTELPNGDAVMIGAPAFADLDADGDLDIVAGNWTAGTIGTQKNPHLPRSRDRILWNEKGQFKEMLLPGVPGETLTSLIADVDGNGHPDILIGDDLALSDKVYLNFGERQFKLARKSDGLIPWLTHTTMSFDTGDFDNDLRPDLYVAQISYSHQHRAHGDPVYRLCRFQHKDRDGLKSCYARIAEIERLGRLPTLAPGGCLGISNPQYHAACAAMGVMHEAGTSGDASLCELIKFDLTEIRKACELVSEDRIKGAEKTMLAHGYIGGLNDRNVLLKASDRSAFSDITQQAGAGRPGWSWNAKFADLDQDGWQDIFVATGYLLNAGPNVFYRNTGAGSFADSSKAFNLSDPLPSSTYVLVDFDRDGDLDIIRPSHLREPIVHRNDKPLGGSLIVHLRDRGANTRAIGAQIVVEYEDRNGANIQQIREIKASGGFASFDGQWAHFGLGKAEFVRHLQIKWPDGGITQIRGPVRANAELVISRD